ncbi:MAG: hypothetical protein WAU06_01100, partial [Candidatus Nanopelagicales bacterium]
SVGCSEALVWLSGGSVASLPGMGFPSTCSQLPSHGFGRAPPSVVSDVGKGLARALITAAIA